MVAEGKIMADLCHYIGKKKNGAEREEFVENNSVLETGS